MKHLRSLATFILLILLSYGSIRPLLSSGYFPMHDDTQVARVYVMAKALSSGQFPVRWVSDLGYGFGYPLFNFYAPLPYYIGGIINLSGIDIVTSTKLMFIASAILATLTMFILGNRLFGFWGGLLASVYFTYAPYKAVDIYVRGAVGEFWAMALLPLLFLGVYLIMTDARPVRKSFLITALSLSALILSHNIIAMLTLVGITIFFIIYFTRCLYKGKLKKALILFLAIGLGMGLSAFFWFPAITEKNFTSVSLLTSGGVDFHSHFVYIQQIWDSPWGYGGSAPGLEDGLSFKVGKLNILTAFVSLVLLLINKKANKALAGCILVLVSICILSIFMSSSYSYPVWDSIGLLSYVQFPWRFLVFLSFALTLLSGSLFLSIKRFQSLIFVFLSAFTIVLQMKYFFPRTLESKPVDSYYNSQELQWRVSKISDEYLPLTFPRPDKLSDTRGSGLIYGEDIGVRETLKQTSTELVLRVINSHLQPAVLAITAFPGWQVIVDDKAVQTYAQDGKIAFYLSQGERLIQTKFTDTPVRIISNWISMASILCAGLVFLYGKKANPS